MVVKGYIHVKSPYPTFIFYAECQDYSSNPIVRLDKIAYKRLAGQQRFLEGSFHPEDLTSDERDVPHLSRLARVMSRHPIQVY